jgi:hypothetical protein
MTRNVRTVVGLRTRFARKRAGRARGRLAMRRPGAPPPRGPPPSRHGLSLPRAACRARPPTPPCARSLPITQHLLRARYRGLRPLRQALLPALPRIRRALHRVPGRLRRASQPAPLRPSAVFRSSRRPRPGPSCVRRPAPTCGRSSPVSSWTCLTAAGRSSGRWGTLPARAASLPARPAGTPRASRASAPRHPCSSWAGVMRASEVARAMGAHQAGRSRRLHRGHRGPRSRGCHPEVH